MPDTLTQKGTTLQRIYLKLKHFHSLQLKKPLIRNELPHLFRRYRRHVHHRMSLQHSAPDLQYLRNCIAIERSSYQSGTLHPMPTL